MIQIKVDRDRMSRLLTVDDYLGLLDHDVRIMVRVLSNYVLDDNGQYLPQDKGRKEIGKLTLEELGEAVSAFSELAEGAAVPPSNGAV